MLFFFGGDSKANLSARGKGIKEKGDRFFDHLFIGSRLGARRAAESDAKIQKAKDKM